MTPGGRWEPVRELGRGGMGVVWEVRDPALPERRLALKRLRADLAGAEDLLRFVREAELLARVRHPGVVVVHEVGRDAAGPWLVTDLVEGEPLAALVARGPVEPARAVELVVALAEALEALHRAGIVHRDLKPENVVVRGDGRPVLLDFGLAREMNAASLTRSGELLGTPAWMAPEQARDPRRADAQADVYALGAILYALLRGRPPFTGPALTVLVAQERGPEWPCCADRALDAVCRRAMALAPGERFPSAAALAAALRRGDVRSPARRGALALALITLAGGAALLGALRDPSPATLAAERAPPRPALAAGSSGLASRLPDPRELRRRLGALSEGSERVAAWREACAGLDAASTASPQAAALREVMVELGGALLASARPEEGAGQVAVTFLPDGRLVLVAGQGLWVWDALEPPRRLVDRAATASPALAALAGPGGPVLLASTAEGELERVLPGGALETLTLPGGQVVSIVADPRQAVALVATVERVFLCEPVGPLRELQLPHPSGNRVVIDVVWDPSSARCGVAWTDRRDAGSVNRRGGVAWFDGGGARLGQLPWAYTADGVSALALTEGELVVGMTGGPLARLTEEGLVPLIPGASAAEGLASGAGLKVIELRAGRGGRLFLARFSTVPGRPGGDVRLLTPASGGRQERLLHRHEGSGLASLALAPDERTLAVGTCDGRVLLLAAPP